MSICRRGDRGHVSRRDRRHPVLLASRGTGSLDGTRPAGLSIGIRQAVDGHIYKGGNKGARRSVWLATKTDYAHYKKGVHPIGNFVVYLRSENKACKISVTAGACMLLTIMYHVLVMQQPFSFFSLSVC